MMTALQLFGATVRARRKALGLTQQALAALTGLHPNYIGGIERGERNVSLRNILRLAVALAVAPADLFQPFTTHPELWMTTEDDESLS
jgi:transcriptional regulator with XRE-family HTH domain